MAQVSVTDLTYGYEGSFDNIFEHVSFSIDTNWKLGFIGRNGKGKTTFLKLLLGKYEYSGSIASSTGFDYFPYEILEENRRMCATDFLEQLKPGCEEWRVLCELDTLNADANLLYRPFEELSHGERTKVLLAILFSGENEVLLIDEPTNHLDLASRELVKKYLKGKKGFILVSHDRDLLDACIDHVLILNRSTIQVQNGNFTSWWENKERMDQFAAVENEKHLRQISALKKAALQSRKWADKNERTKIGFDPVKEHDRCLSTRAYIGAKTKKLQSRVTQYEKRIKQEIEEKEGLLQDIENPDVLKLMPLVCQKERLILCKNLSVGYGSKRENVIQNMNFELKRGERVFLYGKNGCGKSTLIKTILSNNGETDISDGLVITEGEISCASGLKISYCSQDTDFLKGDVYSFAGKRNLDESLFFTMLRKLDIERTQFSKNMEDFSEGQKKKILIAACLLTPAHLYIWDEPLNYIDVFTRMQIEALILKYQPTMLVVEHDIRFQEKIATRIVEL